MTRAHALKNPRPWRRPFRLVKPDRPRAIDRYIDYFGGAAGHIDPCGEALLECFGADAEAEPVNPAGQLASNP